MEKFTAQDGLTSTTVLRNSILRPMDLLKPEVNGAIVLKAERIGHQRGH